MDNKNVFVAIALSMSVLLFWGAFFETPKKESQNLKIDSQIQQKTENQITPSANQSPSINQINIKKKLSREDSLNKSNRIKIENKNIIGSISLAFPPPISRYPTGALQGYNPCFSRPRIPLMARAPLCSSCIAKKHARSGSHVRNRVVQLSRVSVSQDLLGC